MVADSDHKAPEVVHQEIAIASAYCQTCQVAICSDCRAVPLARPRERETRMAEREEQEQSITLWERALAVNGFEAGRHVAHQVLLLDFAVEMSKASIQAKLDRLQLKQATFKVWCFICNL
ncbi:unnamed protein product [Protopolystoma xenopodis]|uniref:Uncharacterized protein n=1 Tax=Protopolystoma xenopodis TaxID=117903 RepID=A0A3S5FE70_9PLAT|nr:unnamed protein product [Protopolystoma xenopodis]